jgi:hypothetical protein
VDWTVFLTFKILIENEGFDLPPAAGTLQVNFKNLDDLTLEDVMLMAQKIAFERHLWHEVTSWYHCPPNYVLSEKQSTFTPEDLLAVIFPFLEFPSYSSFSLHYFPQIF